MNGNAHQTLAASGAFDQRNAAPTVVSLDFAVVCLWSFLGLDLSALALAQGLGADIAEILLAAN